jgi:hypothetical protein
VEWQSEPASESPDELAVFQAFGPSQIVIQMADHQIVKPEHWQQMKQDAGIDSSRDTD